MNTTNIIRKTTLSAVLGGLAIAGVLGSTPGSANAASTVSSARTGGTFTLTFNGQTTAGAKGGNVEYEWKVEEAGFSLGSPTLFSGDTRVEGDEHEIEYDLVAAK